MYDNEFETIEIKIKTNDKIEPQHTVYVKYRREERKKTLIKYCLGSQMPLVRVAQSTSQIWFHSITVLQTLRIL